LGGVKGEEIIRETGAKSREKVRGVTLVGKGNSD